MFKTLKTVFKLIPKKIKVGLGLQSFFTAVALNVDDLILKAVFFVVADVAILYCSWTYIKQLEELANEKN